MSRIKIISKGVLILLFALAPFAFGQAIPEDPSKGGQLFVSKGCATCHALNGEGGKIGPDLGKIDLGDTQLNLAAKIWNHTPSMIIEMERTGIMKSTLTVRNLLRSQPISTFLDFLMNREIRQKGDLCIPRKAVFYVIPLQAKGEKVRRVLMDFQRMCHLPS